MLSTYETALMFIQSQHKEVLLEKIRTRRLNEEVERVRDSFYSQSMIRSNSIVTSVFDEDVNPFIDIGTY